jgi:parallel beta-helix repeat protein
MKKNSLLLASLAIFSLSAIAEVSFSPPDATGADFSNTTPEVTVYVSPEGNDQADGTKGNPVKSLAAAGTLVKTNLEAGRGTEMRLTAGTWRENLPDFGPGDSALFIEGDPEGGTVISGSDVWMDGWTRKTVGDKLVWQHDWTHNFHRFRSWNDKGPDYETGALANYRQVLFLDGRLQRQILDKDELQPGTYYVDEMDLLAPDGHILVMPPEGVDFETATKETSMRGDSVEIKPEFSAKHNDYVPTWPPKYLFQIDGRENLIIRNITFQHANNRLLTGAVHITGAKNVLLENCRIAWNNGAGFALYRTEGITVRNCDFSHNGGAGVTSHFVKNSIWENNRFAENNWRGIMGFYAKYAIAGIKIHYYDNCIFRGNQVIGNESDGLWIDLMNKRILVENNEIAENLRFGIFYEVSWGGAIFRDNLIARNGSGFIIKGSPGGLIENNTFVENAIAVFNEKRLFAGDENIRPLKVWDNVPTDWTIRGNAFTVREITAEDYPRQVKYGQPEWFSRRLAKGPQVTNVFSMVHPNEQQFAFLKTLTWENNTVDSPDEFAEHFTIASSGGQVDQAAFLEEVAAIQTGKMKTKGSAEDMGPELFLSPSNPKIHWGFERGQADTAAGWQRKTRNFAIAEDKDGSGYGTIEDGFLVADIQITPEVTQVKISLRMKATGMDPSVTEKYKKAILKTYFKSPHGQSLGPKYNWLVLEEDSEAWVSLEDTYEVPEGTESISLQLGKPKPSAQMGFDDVTVEAVGFADMEQME